MSTSEAHQPDRRAAESPATLPPARPAPLPSPEIRFDVSYRQVREAFIDAFEREYFAKLLVAYRRRVALAARAVGVDRTYVYKIMKRHTL